MRWRKGTHTAGLRSTVIIVVSSKVCRNLPRYTSHCRLNSNCFICHRSVFKMMSTPSQTWLIIFYQKVKNFVLCFAPYDFVNFHQHVVQIRIKWRDFRLPGSAFATVVGKIFNYNLQLQLQLIYCKNLINWTFYVTITDVKLEV